MLTNTGFEGLTQDLQEMAAELRPFIQAAHPVLREGQLARHRPVAPADPPRVRDGAVQAGRLI